MHPVQRRRRPQGGGGVHLLGVWAAGKDSILWRQVNCLGRSVFLENSPGWIKKVLAMDSALEVYKVDYNTSVERADEWFNGGRWSLDVPAAVSNLCYDVILVDSPQGHAPKMPGGCAC
jgi:hypothetical protein